MFLLPNLLSKMLVMLQKKVAHLDSLEITAFDLDYAVYVKETLQMHYLERVTKSRIKSITCIFT